MRQVAGPEARQHLTAVKRQERSEDLAMNVEDPPV